jgi:hypothetical protein
MVECWVVSDQVEPYTTPRTAFSVQKCVPGVDPRFRVPRFPVGRLPVLRPDSFWTGDVVFVPGSSGMIQLLKLLRELVY